MIFSPKMPLKDFIYQHYNRSKGYRLTFSTKDNTCVYAELEYIRVPELKRCIPIPFGEFAEMMLTRKWAWQHDSRFHSLYVYVIKQQAYVFDRDNIEIEDYRTDFMKVQNEYTPKKKPVFQDFNG